MLYERAIREFNNIYNLNCIIDNFFMHPAPQDFQTKPFQNFKDVVDNKYIVLLLACNIKNVEKIENFYQPPVVIKKNKKTKKNNKNENFEPKKKTENNRMQKGLQQDLSTQIDDEKDDVDTAIAIVVNNEENNLMIGIGNNIFTNNNEGDLFIYSLFII